MTDNYISSIKGHSNKFLATLLNDSNKTGNYIDRATWKEELFNDECQFEEFENEEHQNEDYSNIIEEKSRKEALFDLTNGYTPSNITVKVEQICKNSEFNFFIIESHNFDVINNFYLEIELDNNLDEITMEEKYALLNSRIKISTVGDTIEDVSIMACLCNQICYGNNIKEDNHIIQIPLYNFDTCVDKKYNVKGHPVCHACPRIYLYLDNKIKHFNYKIIANGQAYPKDIREHIKTSRYSHVILQSQYERGSLSIWRGRHKLNFNHIAKYFLIYFSPDKNVDFWQMNENYPLICKLTLYVNGKNVLEFENEDLLDFEIFGIKIYLLPLCKEFSSFENINNTLKNPLKKLSSSGINLTCCNTYIDIEFENEQVNTYNFNIICVDLNCIRITGGISNLAYSS